MTNIELLCNAARDSLRAHIADILEECTAHLREERADTKHYVDCITWLGLRYSEQVALLFAIAESLAESGSESR